MSQQQYAHSSISRALSLLSDTEANSVMGANPVMEDLIAVDLDENTVIFLDHKNKNIIFIPYNQSYNNCIQLLLSFTNIISNEQTEIGLDLFELLLYDNKSNNDNKKSKRNKNIKQEYIVFGWIKL